MNDDQNRIFISIAAYRDPQLVPTIDDCILKADKPDRLRFGICWQHEADDPGIPNSNDSQFRLLDVPWQQSRGACWARAEVMKLWQGEEWFLQLDSHCRLARGWDTKLIQYICKTASSKPILSTYACAFTPGENSPLTGDPLQVGFREFSMHGIPCFAPIGIPNWKTLKKPFRARFLSAGFLFTHGKFVEEVPYDPELYFLGEEIALSMRAFTSGYDIFHPSEPIVWHEYRRTKAPKHWSDHVKSKGIDREWHLLDATSKTKVKQLLAGEYIGPYGLGSVRTLKEYEAYTGLDFRLRRAQDYTRRGLEPPNPKADPDWAQTFNTWQVQIEVNRASLPSAALDDPAFWYVGIHDHDDLELYRRDVTSSEFDAVVTGQTQIIIERSFDSSRLPTKWTVWPKSRSAGWLQKIQGSLDDRTRKIVG